MIVRMKKVFVVARADRRRDMLEALRQLGVVHLEPVDPKAGMPEDLRGRLDRARRARQVIAAVAPAGQCPDLEPAAAVDEILTIVRRSEETRSRLNALTREASRVALWGELRREQLDALVRSGVGVKFFSVPAKRLGEVSAECVAPLTELSGKRVLVAVVQRDGEPDLPDDARPVAPPERDLPSLRAEAKSADEALAAHARRLAGLATLGDALEANERKLGSQAQLATALAGAMRGEDLLAIQGWAPAESAGTLSEDLARMGVAAGVNARDPEADEQPPTLVRYPRWARPVKGLFDVLGTSPGYREFDVSVFFMLALPIFAAMLIGDAGYGLVFLLLPALFYRRMVAAAGGPKVNLLMVFGAVTIAWGLLTGNVFGLTPKGLMDAGGVWASVGGGLYRLQLIRGDLTEQTHVIMKVSFVLGTVHLSLARLRQGLKLAPNLRALSNVGWVLFLWGVLGIVWYLFFGSQQSPPRPMHPATGWLLAAGGALAILFAHPSRNPLKMIAFGVASFPLSAIGTFSDTISYIRLMAVGMASAVIGQTFNSLGAQCANVATWAAGAPIVLIGHSLNIALCLIAILAHGVRLNMLEFSSNAGVEWAGYAYEPFAKLQVKES